MRYRRQSGRPGTLTQHDQAATAMSRLLIASLDTIKREITDSQNRVMCRRCSRTCLPYSANPKTHRFGRASVSCAAWRKVSACGDCVLVYAHGPRHAALQPIRTRWGSQNKCIDPSLRFLEPRVSASRAICSFTRSWRTNWPMAGSNGTRLCPASPSWSLVITSHAPRCAGRLRSSSVKARSCASVAAARLPEKRV